MGSQQEVLKRGFATLLSLQVFTRIVTFFVNLLIVRRLGPEDVGLSLQFHLLTTTVLLLSREGFRRGCLRAKEGASGQGDASEVLRILGVSCLPIPVGLILTPAICGFHYWHALEADDVVYANAVVITGLGVFVELMSEPLYIISNVWLRFRLRLVVEGLATFLRGFGTLMLLYCSNWAPITVFASGQLMYAIVLLLGYGSLVPEIYSKAGSSLTTETFQSFDRDTLSLSGVFAIQAFEKLLLAEGSKFVLVAVESRYNQGVYALVSNLGSTIVRTIFQPIEEVAFTAFSRSGASPNDASSMRELSTSLASLLRGVIIVGLLAVTFGKPYSSTVLQILYSKKWGETEAPTVLAWYCGYILFLAVNGVTEAFIHAVLDSKNLAKSNVWMLFVAIVHMVGSYFFVTTLGSVGLVIADGVNMVLRIAFSVVYIMDYFQNAGLENLRGIFPSKATMLGLLAAGCVANTSEYLIFSRGIIGHQLAMQIACHIGVAVVGLVPLLLVMYRYEMGTLHRLSGKKRD